MTQKIVFACGGTLGHILPAVSFAHALKEDNRKRKIIFIMTKKDEKYEFIKNDPLIDKIYYYDVDGFNRKKTISNISNFIKILKVIKKIKENILDASLVMGMGGYISTIVLKIAKKLKKQMIIHEQNKIMGLANKLIYKDVSLVLSAFPLDNIDSVVIGNPRLHESQKYQKEKKNHNHILVVSGSLGSYFINNLVVSWLKTKESKKYFTTLITGRRYYESVKEELKNCGDHFFLFPYVENLLAYMAEANLVISRAGATTIFEIIGLEIPSILIPSPNVTNNHQYHNARYLKEKGACVLLEERKIKEDMINKYIEHTINNTIIIDNLRSIKRDYQEINILEVLKKCLKKS